MEAFSRTEITVKLGKDPCGSKEIMPFYCFVHLQR